MSKLAQETCVACRGDAARLTETEITTLHIMVPTWDLIVENGVKKLSRIFGFPNFSRAMEFTDAIGTMAESEGHHPRLITEWGRVTLAWWTHKIHGLHRNDFIMASKSESLYKSFLKPT